MNGDLKYALYRHGKGLKQRVEDLLNASGVYLSKGKGFKELQQFQEYLSDYKIIVYDGLNPDRLVFRGNPNSAKKLYLLYDQDSGHYNVVTNIKAAMAKRYICNGCDTLYDLNINVTKFAPCVPLHHPVLKIRLSIVVHVTDDFSVRSVTRII